MTQRIAELFHQRFAHLVIVALFGLLPLTLLAGVSDPQPAPAAQAPAESTESADVTEASTATEAEVSNRAPRPKLRAGITEQQLEHAITIVETGQEMDLPRRAYVVAIATALQESRLSVLANVHVPDSFDYQPRDGYGGDHDSVGIFQQRVRYYCVNDLTFCMDPRYGTMKFYHDLQKVSGWEDLPVTVAAQRVQGSAFPDHYAKHQGAAELIVDSILEWQQQ